MGYHSLEIYKLASALVIEIHKMTVSDLPAFETYETGSQIRRSIKSVKANIVEGYGRRKHKRDFLHFLEISYASLIETISHLDDLFNSGSLKDKVKFEKLNKQLDLLARKLKCFIRSVERLHNT